MRFDVLSRDLNVFAPHFLEASAGTGKTFAIEHLVTRLLIEGQNPLTIEQILVVTFTRASVRELKLRIRRNLAKIKEALSSSNPSIDYVKAILEEGSDAAKSAIDRIDAALICYDAAQIFTLHGFSHRILKEFAFEAGINLEVSDPDERAHLSLIEQCVKDHLKEGVKLPDYSAFQMKALLGKYKRNPRRMIASLVDTVMNGKEISSSPSYSELLDAFQNTFKTLPLIDADAFKNDLSLLTPNYKKMTGEEIPSQIELLASVLSEKECTAEQFDQFLKGDFFIEKMGADNLKVRAKLPEHNALRYPCLVEKLRQSLLPIIEMAKDPSRIFLRLAHDLQKSSQLLLEKKEKFSPDALLLKVEKALHLPSFVDKVRQKYRGAIIDEFQDTDPIQWNIFQNLFLSHAEALCLVGDPKQSIYAFRNADVYTYLAAAKAMGDSARKHLDTNYRSTGPLIDALNLLFGKAQGRWIGLPGSHEILEVTPVKAGAKLRADETQAPLQFFVCTGKKGRSKKFPTAEMLENKAFPYIASEISLLHSQKQVQLHDIAILIKDRYQAQAIVDYLKDNGIPASFKRGALITDSFSYEGLKEVIAAVLEPYEMSKVKTALGGALIAWEEELLCNGWGDPLLLQAKAQMQMLHQILIQRGFGPFFQTLLNTCFRTQQPLLQEMLDRGDLSLYLGLRKIAELLIEEEMEHGLKGEAFLTFLEEIAVDRDRDDSRLKLTPEEEKGSVTVMTMHMSKGLEFDTVFAIGVASRHKISDQISVKHDGHLKLKIYDPADPDCRRAVEEQDAEKMRQFYVALTRAKTRLYIPLMIEEDLKEIEFGEASPSELFFARAAVPDATHQELYDVAKDLNLEKLCLILESLAPLVQYRILQEVTELNPQKLTPANPHLIQPQPLSLPIYDQQLLSFTALAKKQGHLETVKPSENAALSPHTLPLGSETGHALHRIFEKIFKRGLHHPLDERSLSMLIDEQIAFSPLEHHRPIILPWVVDLLKQPIVEFSLSEVPRGKLQQEMEFFFPVSNGIMKGFADLFFEFNGKYYLLDWKSNYLGPSDEDYTIEKIEQAMKDNDYGLQASIYAGALQRLVKLFDNRPFSECFGGAIYYFVRGRAVHHFIPELFKDVPL